MYKFLLLDIDNTLLDFDTAERRGFQKIIELSGLEFQPEMLTRYKVINRRLWDGLEQETVGREEVFNTRFREFFLLYGKEADGPETEQHYRSLLNESADLLPHAKETLITLKQMEKKLYSASNGVYTTQISRLKKAGIYDLFDGMFISEKAGSEKPSPHFFEYCFKNIPGFEKEETLMVGDSLTSDIQGAVNAGIDSCLVLGTGAGAPGAAVSDSSDTAVSGFSAQPAAKNRLKGSVPYTYSIQDISGLLNLPSSAKN